MIAPGRYSKVYGILRRLTWLSIDVKKTHAASICEPDPANGLAAVLCGCE